MIKLICDLNIHLRGHNVGYAQYVLNNIRISEREEIFFLFNKQAKYILDFLDSPVPTENILFTEMDFKHESILGKLKFKEWKIIEKYADILKVDKLLLMDLTRYEVQLGRSSTSFRISGIEFRPSHRINITEGTNMIKLTAMIQRYKRRFFESIILRSDSLEHIYILNDPAGVEELNKRYKTNVFMHLVDPIFDYKEIDDQMKSTTKPVNTDRVVFIIFGSLDWRKNFKNIFSAFNLVKREIHNDITLLIVGTIPSYYQDEYNSLTDGLRKSSPEIDLIIVEEFVSDSQMEYYFSISDISLTIYSKFYGSSALLGRAAKYNVTSLVPSVGLMAQLCDRYKLGYLCNPNSVEDISEKIYRAYQDIKMKKVIDGTAFYSTHSPQLFLEILDL